MRKTNHRLKTVTAICLLCYCCSSFAQMDTSHLFWSQDLKETTPEKAAYQGISIRDNDTWHLTVYHLGSRKKVLSCYYKDAALTQREGLYETFYEQGEKKTRGYYNEGTKAGWWKGWDENGYLTDSIFFEDSIAKVSYLWYYSEALVLRSYEINNLRTGQKSLTTYDDNGHLESENEFMGKEGESKIYHPDGGVFQITKFNQYGDKILVQRFKQDGSEMTEKEYQRELDRHTIFIRDDPRFSRVQGPITVLGERPDYTGGRNEFDKFVSDNIKLPQKFSDGSHGTLSVRFSFYLNRKGNPYNVKVIRPADKELEKAIADVLKTITPWDMRGHENYGPLVRVINIMQ